MARKTAIRITNAELAAEDFKATERTDRATPPNIAGRNLLPSLAEWREARDRMTERELLDRAKSAAALEARGVNYSGEDRADMAAEIVRRTLLDTGGALPPRTSPTVTLTAYCGVARNLRDSLDRQRRRDAADAKRAAETHAQSAAALGIGADVTPAAHAAIVARSGEHAAESAVSAVLSLLRVTAEPDTGQWLALYEWLTERTSEQIGEARGISAALVRKRLMVGRKFFRDFYTAADLAAALTLGAYTRGTGDAAETTLVMADDSREAHGRTPIMADPAAGRKHWREGTAAGNRADKPTTRDAAREACQCSKQNVRPKRERERAKGDVAAETAAALRRLARIHAMGSRRAPSTPRNSMLARAIVEGA